ncbi:ArsR family transcriptional regulator [Gillisia sp. M10.2A]|uniref:ArsR family transcriptional regulator n=1 Tax=Gillisia lutea TaxID=2909668 RepID=A0ABS9EHB3_9FLAO|nr:ArsR family transcriptional regulator [Gillisia lutea]MCF4101544.1 ArsR family transcriptional regulator [Gillisia lutea]
MDILEINKVLSNKVRLQILQWLKNPQQHFPPHEDLKHFEDGVCVQYIRKKAGLSQSTISHYLSMMHNAGLVEPTRYGKWTYYKRIEKTVSDYLITLKKEL